MAQRWASEKILDEIDLKLKEIYLDLSHNVTQIYGREDLLLAVDLVYHSVLRFAFGNKTINKGWVDALVLGDTRCGKTETVQSIIGHYRQGELLTGETATRAGILGGLQQTQKHWAITWGKAPLNDRRLIVIDEASGLSIEDIGRLSGMRSSGVAEITGIQAERTFARTRMIWLSNPRANKPLRYYSGGVDAVRELIGRPEDVARLDFCITVASGEVLDEIINASKRTFVPHVYNTNSCNTLVLWAWSRKKVDIIFTEEARLICLQCAGEMSHKYSSTFPIVEGAEQRIKLARLSVALAARLYNSPDGIHLVVLPEHVLYIRRFLDRIYSKPSFGYNIYSKARIEEATIPNEDEIKRGLIIFERVNVDTGEVTNDVVRCLYSTPVVSLRDVIDFTSGTRETATTLISFLVQKRCLKRMARGGDYYKLPAFIALLSKMYDQYKEQRERIMKGEG